MAEPADVTCFQVDLTELTGAELVTDGGFAAAQGCIRCTPTRGPAVVGREDDQCAVVDIEPFERVEQDTGGPVDFFDRITPAAVLTLAVEVL